MTERSSNREPVAALAGFDDTVDHYELLGAFAKAP